MSSPTVIVHRTPDELAAAVCARLVTALVDVQSTGRVPHWVLTGGTIAHKVHTAIAESSARDAVDWSRVELWWGDERFVSADSPDRNQQQVREALLDSLRLDPARVHSMPSPDEVADPDAAASAYAETLRKAAQPEDHGVVPTFDVLMLGVGPDGHVASLFPERPALYEEERPVVAVRGAPKPPPTRLTLTMPSLQHAREVWFVVSGEDKAKAVHLALSGAGVVQIPAAGPRGLQRTLWLLDQPAASLLPSGLARL